MVVVSYERDVVEFYCSKCGFQGSYDVTNLVSDNCAVDIDIICEVCNNHSVLYVLRCKDPAQARELNARLEFLKIKRAAEREEDYE